MPDQIETSAPVEQKKFTVARLISGIIAVVIVAVVFVYLKKPAQSPTITPSGEINPAISDNSVDSTSSKTGSAALSWKANTESDLAGYTIYYGILPRTDNCPPGGYPNQIDVGKTGTPNSPAYKINSLENGKKYYFSIASYDTSGNRSCFSAEISKIMPPVSI